MPLRDDLFPAQYEKWLQWYRPDPARQSSEEAVTFLLEKAAAAKGRLEIERMFTRELIDENYDLQKRVRALEKKVAEYEHYRCTPQQ